MLFPLSDASNDDDGVQFAVEVVRWIISIQLDKGVHILAILDLEIVYESPAQITVETGKAAVMIYCVIVSRKLCL